MQLRRVARAAALCTHAELAPAGPRHAVRNKIGKIKLANLYEGGNAGGL